MKLDPTQARQVAEWKHSAPLLGARVDPTGRFVFAGGQDSAVQRWEMSSGKKTAFVGHASWVRALGFAAKAKLVITGDYHGRAMFWPFDADVPKPAAAIAAHDGWLRALAVSPDGRTLATAGNDGLVKLWSLPEGKPLRSLSGHNCHVYNVAFRPDGLLASADLKGIVKLWDANKGVSIRELDATILHKYDEGFRADIGGARGMGFSSDGSLLACCGITEVSNAFAGVGKPLVVVFDVATGKRQHLLRPKDAFQGTAWGVALHPAGYVVAVGGGNGGALWFWNTVKGDHVFTLKLPQNARDLDLHPDGKRLIVAFADGALRVYDMSPKVAIKDLRAVQALRAFVP